MKRPPAFYLPPLATPPDEEPDAAGGWQVRTQPGYQNCSQRKDNLPPPVTMPEEEPSATGGRYNLSN